MMKYGRQQGVVSYLNYGRKTTRVFLKMSSEEEIEQSTSKSKGSRNNTQNAKSVELDYDPDQNVEDKRKIRAQYRQLLSIQDG
jgi:hypothetical protein